MHRISWRTILKMRKTCPTYHNGLCRQDSCFAKGQFIGPIGALPGTACLMACTAVAPAAKQGLYISIQEPAAALHINRIRDKRNSFWSSPWTFRSIILRRCRLVSGICCSRWPFTCSVLCVDCFQVPFSLQAFLNLWFATSMTRLWHDQWLYPNCIIDTYNTVNMKFRDVKKDDRFAELLSNCLRPMYRTMDKIYCSVHKSNTGSEQRALWFGHGEVYRN